MKTPLALLNLLHDKKRTGVAVAGVTFAVVLVLMQWGFYGAVEKTAANVYSQLSFDLILISHDYKQIAQPGIFPRMRLEQARGVEHVSRVMPVQIGFALWQYPYTDLPPANPGLVPGRRRGMLVLGCDPNDPLFSTNPELSVSLPALKCPGTVLIDRASRPEFGPQKAGTTTEASDKRVNIVGSFTIGTGFAADGTAVVGKETFNRLFGGLVGNNISLGLVGVRARDEPQRSQQIADVKAQLLQLLPPDVQVLTRDEMLAAETHHWVSKTSVGKIFGLGVVLALIVGMAIVYQVLSSDVTNRLGEFATLKAMGYARGYLSAVVLKQAILLGLVGFLPGLVLSLLLYGWTREQASIPISMTPGRATLVLLMIVSMCCLSGLAALRKVHYADPADLF